MAKQFEDSQLICMRDEEALKVVVPCVLEFEVIKLYCNLAIQSVIKKLEQQVWFPGLSDKVKIYHVMKKYLTNCHKDHNKKNATKVDSAWVVAKNTSNGDADGDADGDAGANTKPESKTKSKSLQLVDYEKILIIT